MLLFCYLHELPLAHGKQHARATATAQLHVYSKPLRHATGWLFALLPLVCNALFDHCAGRKNNVFTDLKNFTCSRWLQQVRGDRGSGAVGLTIPKVFCKRQPRQRMSELNWSNLANTTHNRYHYHCYSRCCSCWRPLAPLHSRYNHYRHHHPYNHIYHYCWRLAVPLLPLPVLFPSPQYSKIKLISYFNFLEFSYPDHLIPRIFILIELTKT